MFSIETNMFFGYNKTLSTSEFDARNDFLNGRVCETGYSKFNGAPNVGICAEILNINAGLIPGTLIGPPYSCNGFDTDEKCYYEST